MNVNEIELTEESLAKQLSMRNNLSPVIILPGRGDAIEKEDMQKLFPPSNGEKSDESNVNTNEKESNDLNDHDADKPKDQPQSYLHQKRTRSAKENILDMDSLYEYLYGKEPVSESYGCMPITNSSEKAQKCQRTFNSTEKKKNKEKNSESTKKCVMCRKGANASNTKSALRNNSALSLCSNCLSRSKKSDNCQSPENINDNNLKGKSQSKSQRKSALKQKAAQEEEAIDQKEINDLKQLIRITAFSGNRNRVKRNLSINNFNIMEIERDGNANDASYSDFNEDDYASPPNEGEDEAIMKSLSNKEASKLIATSKQCEEYYKEGGDGLQCADSSLACFRCKMADGNKSELMRFSTIKELMNYLKYAFVFQSKILCINNRAYAKNKREFFRINILSFIVGWKFHHPKVICKCCFIFLINMDNLIGQLKLIFSDESVANTNDSKRNRPFSRKRLKSRAFKRNCRKIIKKIKEDQAKLNNQDNNTEDYQEMLSSQRSARVKRYNKHAVYDQEKNLIVIDKSKINCCTNEEESALFDERLQSQKEKKLLQRKANNAHQKPTTSKNQTEPVKEDNNNSLHHIPTQDAQPTTLFASNKDNLQIYLIEKDMQKVIEEIKRTIQNNTQITSPEEFKAILLVIKNYQLFIANHLERIASMNNAIKSQLIKVNPLNQTFFIRQLEEIEEKCKSDMSKINEAEKLFWQYCRKHLFLKILYLNLFMAQSGIASSQPNAHY